MADKNFTISKDDPRRPLAKKLARGLARLYPDAHCALQFENPLLRPSGLRFAPNFNAAVPFIDRHISEGRGAKIAIRTSDTTTTYADLAANVDRCGAGLARLGLRRGDRMLMVVKDCPAFFYLFWGAIKAGIVPVPLNTLLRSSSYAFMIDDSSAAALVYSSEFAGSKTFNKSWHLSWGRR